MALSSPVGGDPCPALLGASVGSVADKLPGGLSETPEKSYWTLYINSHSNSSPELACFENYTSFLPFQLDCNFPTDRCPVCSDLYFPSY